MTAPIRVRVTRRPFRVLHFDIEARPPSYLGADFTTREITAIACSWADDRKIHAWLLGEVDMGEMLDAFRVFYDQADVVSGHYIKRYDLPNINGALLEARRPPLGRKFASDTKDHLRRRQGISVSQESLAGMLDLAEQKHHMTQAAWRQANRLTPDGLAQTRKRVIDDVRQHKQLRRALLEAGWLKPAQVWSP